MLVIKRQFTKMLKLSFIYQCPHGHFWSLSVAPSKSTVTLAKGSKGINYILLKCLSICNWKWVHKGFLMSPQLKIYIISGYLQAILRKLFVDIYWYELLPLFLFGEISLGVCPSFWRWKKQYTFKLIICVYFWIIELQILNRTLLGRFQQNPFPSNTYNCTPIVGDWPVFLFLKRIAKKLPRFYIFSVIVSVHHANIASISHS